MKNVSLIMLLSLAICTGWHCGSNTDKQMAQNPTTPEPATVRETINPETEGEVLALLAQVNKNEIAAAEEAEDKKISQPVKDYAKMLDEAHEDNLDKTMKVSREINISLNKTAEVDMLEEKGKSMLGMLKPLSGKQFETAYIDAMIKGHTEALDLIDNKLMKNAKNEMVLAHLTETRKHVAMHLDEAKRLKGTM